MAVLCSLCLDTRRRQTRPAWHERAKDIKGVQISNALLPGRDQHAAVVQAHSREGALHAGVVVGAHARRVGIWIGCVLRWKVRGLLLGWRMGLLPCDFRTAGILSALVSGQGRAGMSLQ